MNVGDVTHFEVFAPLYDVFMPEADGSPFEREFERADRSIERVLDIGGGTGRASRSIEVQERIVVDPARKMISEAQKHDLDVIQADGSHLPLRPESVDAVLIVDAFHHISDQSSLLTESYRILRPGGVVLVADFDPETLRGRILGATERLVGLRPTFQTPESLRDSLDSRGFDTSIPEPGFGYLVAGTKP